MLKRSLSVKSIIALFMSAVVMVSLFCGCGEQKTTQKEEIDTVTFTDALDREVTVKKNPERVAALIGSFADVWTLAGGTVCASVDDAWDDFDLDLPDAVNLGGAHSPNLELLLSANPDFVIASSSTAADVEMKEPLENAGITVAYFDVSSFDDYLAMLKVCTDITGREDLYEQNGLNIKKQIDDVKTEFAKENIPENERTVLILRASSGFVKEKGSEGTVLGELLSDLGCVNIADSDKSLLENLSVESIISRKPYRIFVVVMGDDTEAAKDKLSSVMEENPAWGELEAVKENRLYFMDKKLFNLKPNARWAESYEQLVEILRKK